MRARVHQYLLNRVGGDMVQDSQTITSGSNADDSNVRIAAQMRATITTRVLHSKLIFSSELSRQDIVKALEATAPYLPKSWPPEPIFDDNSMQQVALERMLFTLQLGLNLEGETSEAMSSSLDRKFPQVAIASDSGVRRYQCMVNVQSDGGVTWEYISPEEGDNLPGLVFDLTGKDLNLDNYLKARLVLSLKQAIEDLGS